MENNSNETARGGVRFRSAPHPALRPFVVEYWGFARDLAAMGGFTITPDCFGELICCVDDLFVVGVGKPEKLPKCFLVGLLDGPLRIEAPGIVRCMAARLQPWSVGQMLEDIPDRTPHGWRDAVRVFGPRLASVSNMIERCDWLPLVKTFDELLIDELDRWQPGGMDIDLAGQFLGEGQRSTSIIARERDITTRQVERRVRKVTQSSPKRLACLSRFQKARDAIWADPSIDLARLAFEAGYSDQPHMTRHFRRYSGQTPASFARGSVERKKWLATQDVAFVQERAARDG